MILLASGRCDIPAFYSEWFYRRLKEGFLDIRNPYNQHQISRIYLTEQHIDGIVFCTKNPIPMLARLDEITLPYLFHITITPYLTDIEPNVIHKKDVIKAVKQLSNAIGNNKILVRYDPIFLNSKYNLDYHERAFESLCKQLKGFISAIVISFIDDYKNVRKHKHELKMLEMDNDMMHKIAKRLGLIASKYHIPIQTCAEDIDLLSYGITATPCFERMHLSNIFNRTISVPTHTGVRKNCACLPTVDIGDYNCCAHHCKYCYANYDEPQIQHNISLHDPNSSVLIGQINEDDHITIRKEKEVQQITLF